MTRQPISAVVTTLDNAGTLQACLASLAFCDEIVVLDSGSSDDTASIAQHFGVRWQVQAFQGYGPQKQAAVNLAQHDWVLLLDADEQLTALGRERIERELVAPRAVGYRLPRQEWLFWRWVHPWSRANWHLRLFRRSLGGLNDVPVHAAPEVRGRVIDLPAPFRHFGEADIAMRAEKVNRYSSGMVAHKRSRPVRLLGLRMLIQPSLAFFKLYVLKRYFLNGWAGFIAARLQAHYTFLKYSKVYEAQRRDQ
ncbi:MAG: glycosyltransferase family 2 protein [Gammaproteobacteria bacterium HGW-Gammaproteobacteria-4]|jgi:glycosyltransferase involved in cell wall biosynthesis|nr:MAG: glycosyltransferase family 2 protein [Gammaproteobacteria bacterium HGW-Gammaproteobacteria-4]